MAAPIHHVCGFTFYRGYVFPTIYLDWTDENPFVTGHEDADMLNLFGYVDS